MKVLLVCDSTYYRYSGGRVVRYINDILKKNNEVEIVVISAETDDVEWDVFYKENNVVFIPQRDKKRYTISNFLFTTKGLDVFKQILYGFTPDIIHFASFDNSKPSKFIIEAKKCGAKVILQPWTMDFFCARNYGYLNDKQCTLCANGNYFNALRNSCISYKSIFSLKNRINLKRASKKADLFLSSNSDLDSILLKYGVDKSKIFRFPIPFDYTSIQLSTPINSLITEDYFIFYGLPIACKGLDALYNIFTNFVSCNLKIYPSTSLELPKKMSNRIEIVNGISWNNGLKDAIVSSKAVLIPSLWSTSTEYSLCEALFLKKAVIVFNVGVHKDIFKNRINAMVVEPNDFEFFAKAVNELENDTELSQTIGENGYNTLLEINNPERINSLLLRAYNLNKTNSI
jgi:glycosyltransferase involved in cell wall biosynthesis